MGSLFSQVRWWRYYLAGHFTGGRNLHRCTTCSTPARVTSCSGRFLPWANYRSRPCFSSSAACSLIALSLFSRLFRKLLSERVLIHTSMDRGHQYAFVRVAGYAIFALGLIVGLDTTGLNLSSLVVVGGALGVGIGFGLQNIVANFVAGVVILWEGPIQAGRFR